MEKFDEIKFFKRNLDAISDPVSVNLAIAQIMRQDRIIELLEKIEDKVNLNHHGI